MTGQVVRVLLIEDDSRLDAQLVQTLASAGYDVRWQQDGQSLVVLDLMLPGQSGLDWLRAFRPTADVPVLVLSARADPQTRVQALRSLGHGLLRAHARLLAGSWARRQRG